MAPLFGCSAAWLAMRWWGAVGTVTTTWSCCSFLRWVSLCAWCPQAAAECAGLPGLPRMCRHLLLIDTWELCRCGRGLVSQATAESVQAFLAANQTFQAPAAPAAAPASGAAPAGDRADGRPGRSSLQPCSLKQRSSACAFLWARSCNGRPSAVRPVTVQLLWVAVDC